MKKYKHTLNLPKTKFSIKASPKRELEILEETADLYNTLKDDNKPTYVLHDGPPYANGNLHHGHILNKVLKDIVYKSRTMIGYNVDFVPGWDCHGLPIENEVDKKLGPKRHKMSKNELRAEYRKYAAKFVDIQREQFKRLGVTADWDNPYLTMSSEYEAITLRELSKCVDAGLVYKDLKPVFWCPTHLTALANSDIEYNEKHVSTSVYALFPMELGCNEFLAVWTTTPWTLSVNKAVAVKEDANYVLVSVDDKEIWVAQDLLDSMVARMGWTNYGIVNSHPGHAFTNERYVNPLSDEVCPIVVSDHVTTDTGTGFVHIAPAHGEDDFRVGRKHGLEIESAILDNGRNKDGLKVSPLSSNVIVELQSKNRLLWTGQYTHSYPYSSRSHKPVIMKATQQWFIAIDKPFNDGPSLRERALAAVDDVEWLPEAGKNRIKGMLESRPDWCISRQRTWGVPVPSFRCKECGESTIRKDLIETLAAHIVLNDNMDFWFEDHSEGNNFGCEHCGALMSLIPETDIVDVWFDSGTSNAAVLGGKTADLYLEGSDQHRGWFQSTLLAALGADNPLPYKTVLTHGFVVADDGEKLSKSKGNFKDPYKVINQEGAEIFRLWVAQSNFRADIRISDEILAGAKQTGHRIRNTIRYLISNLYDFEPGVTKPERLIKFDQEIVRRAIKLNDSAVENYENFNFHAIVKDVEAFCINDLSSFYIEATRDRLYCDAANSESRRSVQMAMYMTVRMLIAVMAPIMSFSMYDAWNHLPGESNSEFVFQGKKLVRFSAPENEESELMFNLLKEIKDNAFVQIEELRAAKKVGANYEATALVSVPKDIRYLLPFEVVRQVLGVSSLSIITDDTNKVHTEVSVASGDQCQRCWRFTTLHAESDVCSRCYEVVKG